MNKTTVTLYADTEQRIKDIAAITNTTSARLRREVFDLGIKAYNKLIKKNGHNN